MKGKINYMQKILRKDSVKHSIIILALMIFSFLIYGWSIDLPIIGDGLMHLGDETHFSSPMDIIKSFYTFNGLDKPENSPTLGFHRPIFNEMIVPIVTSISNKNTEFIRCISIMVHGINSVLAYWLCYLIGKNKKIAIIGGLLFSTSLTYFSGIYEYGLSFSLWLTMFALLAIIFTEKYVQQQRKLYFIMSIFFTFCALFTKESAITLGVALAFYVLVKQISDIGKIKINSCLYCVIQLGGIVLYFTTRYIKLGSFFGIAGGIEQEMDIISMIKKLIGYFLYGVNISNVTIENYLTVYLDKIPLILAWLIVGITGFILIKYFIRAIKDPIFNREIIVSIIMFCILIAPTFKVSRNAPYYGDVANLAILMLFMHIALQLGQNNLKKIIGYLVIYIATFICSFSYAVKNDATVYTQGTNQAKIAVSYLQGISEEKVYQATSWMRNGDNHFIYNHGKYGSFYKYNVSQSSEVNMLNEENIMFLDDNSIVVDYYYNKSDGNPKVFTKVSGSSNKILKITYDYMESYQEVFEIGFNYMGGDYYQNIDLNYKKIWSSDNILYFVVPDDVEIYLSNQYVEEKEYLEF